MARCTQCGIHRRVPAPTTEATPDVHAVAASAPADDERRGLQVLGYLLAAGGFAATLAPGLWLPAGYLGVSAGCVLGLDGTEKRRWLGGLAMGLMLAVLGSTISATVLAGGRGRSGVDDEPLPLLVVSVRSTEYRDGELAVRGTVRNVGKGPAFSPAIELSVHQTSNGKLVASETAYPEDEIETWLQPGDGATFEHLAYIPDDVGSIEWTVTLEDDPGTVIGEDGAASQ